MMTVTVNGERRRVAARTIEALLPELGYDATQVATALDGDFVPARARGSATLRENCDIEILARKFGG